MRKKIFAKICSLAAVVSLLLAGGCDKQGDDLTADYGYVQFQLVKAAQLDNTRAEQLEWLAEAY